MDKVRYREGLRLILKDHKSLKFPMSEVRQSRAERQRECRDQSSSVPGSYIHALSTLPVFVTHCLVIPNKNPTAAKESHLCPRPLLSLYMK